MLTAAAESDAGRAHGVILPTEVSLAALFLLNRYETPGAGQLRRTTGPEKGTI